MKLEYILNALTDKTNYLDKDGDFLIVRRFMSENTSFPANSGKNVEVSITIPDGYKYLTTVMVSTHGNVMPGYYMSFNSSTKKVSTWLKNWNTTSAISCAVSVDVLFIKNMGGVICRLIEFITSPFYKGVVME